MKPLLNPSSIFFRLVLFFISINTPTSLGSDDERFTNCSNTFSCGKISNLKYPFWGGNRAEYCGLPDFQLQCEAKNNTPNPNIIIENITYQILEFDWTPQSLKLVRDDYLHTFCPIEYKNNTFNPNKFKYVDGLMNITLLYNCTIDNHLLPGSQLVNQNCTRDDGQSINVYYVPQPVYTSYCQSTIIMPVFHNLVIQIQSSIDNGFGLQWMVDNDECTRCTKSGGECGYNNTEGQFSCFCRDGPHKTSCSTGTKSGSKTAVKTGIAAGVSAAAACIVVGVGVFFVVKRRKKFAAKSQSNKNLLMPRDSGSLTFTSTTNSSHNQSVPSYVTSKSELSEQHSFLYGIKVFSYAELEEATKNFDPSVELGNGGFGTVYYGTLRDGRAVAVKRLYESNLKRVNQFRNEVEILARLQHPNLVSLFGCTSRHSRELLLVYEYIPNGTLSYHLHQQSSNSNNKPFLPWPTRLNIALETAIALAYLHKSDVIHRDVKTNNILLDNEFRVKVADFGLSRLFPTDVTHVSTAPQGTPGYVDPEYYQCYQLTDKSDVYSFGVVLIELLSSLEAVDVNRSRHFINLANMAVNKIQNRALHELVDPLLGFEREDGVRRTTTAVAELAFRCLQADREMRPSMDEVVQVLRGIIQNSENDNEEKGVIVNNNKNEEEVVLKNNNDPLAFSPDSVVADKWVSYSSSTTTSNNSSS